MKNRRGFLSTLGGLSGAAVMMTMAETAANAAPGRPSAAAQAMAATYRRFDPALRDDELDVIAHAIDDNRAASADLQSKTRPLRNSDEMVVRFAADESI